MSSLVIHIRISESLKYEKKSIPFGIKEIEQLTFQRTSISCINTKKKKRSKLGAFIQYLERLLPALSSPFVLSYPPSSFSVFFLPLTRLDSFMCMPLSLCFSSSSEENRLVTRCVIIFITNSSRIVWGWSIYLLCL